MGHRSAYDKCAFEGWGGGGEYIMPKPRNILPNLPDCLMNRIASQIIMSLLEIPLKVLLP